MISPIKKMMIFRGRTLDFIDLINYNLILYE